MGLLVDALPVELWWQYRYWVGMDRDENQLGFRRLRERGARHCSVIAGGGPIDADGDAPGDLCDRAGIGGILWMEILDHRVLRSRSVDFASLS